MSNQASSSGKLSGDDLVLLVKVLGTHMQSLSDANDLAQLVRRRELEDRGRESRISKISEARTTASIRSLGRVRERLMIQLRESMS